MIDPYKDLDSWSVRRLFLDKIVDYANEYLLKMLLLEEIEH